MADKLAEYVQQNLGRLMKSFTVEERLEGISAEERLKGLSPDDRLKGLSTDDLLKALTPDEQRAMLEELKRRFQSNGGSNSPHDEGQP